MPRMNVGDLDIVCTCTIESRISRDGNSCATTIHIEVVIRAVMLALYQSPFSLDRKQQYQSDTNQYHLVIVMACIEYLFRM